MSSYTPKPGSVAYRILGWLEAQGREKEFNSSQIANALDIDTRAVQSLMQQSLAAGLVFRRQKDRTHPLAPYWWSLTNHGVRQREFTPNPVGWMNVKKDADEVPVFCEVSGRTKSPRMADADSGVGDGDSPIRPTQPTVTNLPGHPLADARSKAARAVMEAIAIAPNSQRHESGAQHGGDAGNLAHNTEHAAPLGGLAEGEGATAPSPGMREAKADEGRPGTTPSRGRIELAVPQFRSITTINRKDAEESGSSPGTPGTAGTPAASCTSSAAQAATDAPSGEGPAAADAPRARAVDLYGGERLLPGDYLVHKRSGIELVYGEGELQALRVSLAYRAIGAPLIDNAKFALWCDGELTLFVGDTELTLKPAQVARLRRLLGGGA